MDQEFKYRCSKCGGTSPEFRADVIWDQLNQKYLVTHVHDYWNDEVYCMDCDTETFFKRVPLDLKDLAQRAIQEYTNVNAIA